MLTECMAVLNGANMLSPGLGESRAGLLGQSNASIKAEGSRFYSQAAGPMISRKWSSQRKVLSGMR